MKISSILNTLFSNYRKLLIGTFLKKSFPNTILPKWVSLPNPFASWSLANSKATPKFKRWKRCAAVAENVYYQFFSGQVHFVQRLPCVPTELVEFRKRIGSQGVELIFKESIKVNGKDADDDTLSADTTVQDKKYHLSYWR
jgi:hypothetical protein